MDITCVDCRDEDRTTPEATYSQLMDTGEGRDGEC